MVAVYSAAGEESMAAEVVHNNRGGRQQSTFNFF
jgi:hypothetical protein